MEEKTINLNELRLYINPGSFVKLEDGEKTISEGRINYDILGEAEPVVGLDGNRIYYAINTDDVVVDVETFTRYRIV